MLSTLTRLAARQLQHLIYLLTHITPNYITLTGTLVPVVFFVFIVLELYIPALITFLFNAVDMLDGYTARSRKQVTPFGGVLDSTIDRFSDYTVFVAFAFGGLVSWYIVAPLTLLSFLISYIRTRTELAACGRLKANVGLIERPARLTAVFFSLLLYTIVPDATLFHLNIISLAFLCLIAFSLITVFQRIIFAYTIYR